MVSGLHLFFSLLRSVFLRPSANSYVNNCFNKHVTCHMCRMMRVVTNYLCKHSITPVLADNTELYAPGQ